MTETTVPRIPVKHLVGRYRLVDPIADGGMGSVWRVWDFERNQYVAAKLLRPADAGSLLRFVREQSLRVVHPHVVAPTGWAAEDDLVLLTMDLVRGGSLAQLLGHYGPLYLSYGVVLVDQLLDALSAVHSHGIVHRDVKPSNLLLEPTGRDRPVVRLADFGVAAVLGEPRLTRADLTVGSPGFLAPERTLGAGPDVRQDLYAAGVVAVRLLTGEGPTADLTGLPEPVREVLLALLAQSPADRPETADAARRAWQSAIEQAGVPPIDPQRPDAVEVLEHVGPLPDGFGPSGPVPGGAVPDLCGPDPGFGRAPPPVPPLGIVEPHAGVLPVPMRSSIRDRVGRRTVAAVCASALAFAVVLAVVLSTGDSDAPTGLPVSSRSASVSSAPAPADLQSPVPSPSAAASSPLGPEPARRPSATAGGDVHRPRDTTKAPAPPPGASSAPKPSPAPGATLVEVPPTACTPNGCAARAYFQRDGDHLFVCDDATDGFGAIAQYTRTDVPGQNNDARDTDGSGTCIDHNMNMPEGSTVTFRVCLLSASGTISSCSARLTTSA